MHLRPVLLALVVLLPSAALAVPLPVQLEHSGYVTSASDAPLETAGAIFRFRLYAAATTTAGETAAWDSGTCSIPVHGGYYSIVLGGACGTGLTTTELPPDAPRYLEVTVEGATLSPRQPILPVPTAVIARTSLDTAQLRAEFLAQESTNRVLNSSFENAPAGVPASWTRSGSASSSVSVSSSQSLFDAQLLSLADTDGAAALQLAQVLVPSAAVLSPWIGNTFTASVYARRTTGSGAGRLCLTDGVTTQCADLTGTSAFARTTVQLVVGAAATQLAVSLSPTSATGADTGSWLFDGVMVTAGSLAPPWSANPADLYLSRASDAPVGEVVTLFANAAPANFLLMNGQLLDKATNPEYTALVDHLQSLGLGTGTTATVPAWNDGRVLVSASTVSGAAATAGTQDAAGSLALSASSTVSVAKNQFDTGAMTQTGGVFGAGSLPSITWPTYTVPNHTHTAGDLAAAIGAVNSDASSLNYVITQNHVNEAGGGCGSYTIFGSWQTNTCGGRNHNTNVLGNTGGWSGATSRSGESFNPGTLPSLTFPTYAKSYTGNATGTATVTGTAALDLKRGTVKYAIRYR